MSYIRSVLWDVIFTQKTYFRILCETIASDSQQHLENMFSLYYFIIIYLRFLYFQILRRKIASFRDAHKSFVDLIYYMFSDSQNLDILLLEYHPKNSIYWRMQYLGFMYLFWMQIVFCFFYIQIAFLFDVIFVFYSISQFYLLLSFACIFTFDYEYVYFDFCKRLNSNVIQTWFENICKLYVIEYIWIRVRIQSQQS